MYYMLYVAIRFGRVLTPIAGFPFYMFMLFRKKFGCTAPGWDRNTAGCE